MNSRVEEKPNVRLNGLNRIEKPITTVDGRTTRRYLINYNTRNDERPLYISYHDDDIIKLYKTGARDADTRTVWKVSSCFSTHNYISTFQRVHVMTYKSSDDPENRFERSTVDGIYYMYTVMFLGFFLFLMLSAHKNHLRANILNIY